MMQLLIEGLKPEYAVLRAAIESATSCDKDACIGALNCICNKLVLSSTVYQDMRDGRAIVENAAKDMEYVRGELTEEEERERIDWHYSRLEESL